MFIILFSFIVCVLGFDSQKYYSVLFKTLIDDVSYIICDSYRCRVYIEEYSNVYLMILILVICFVLLYFRPRRRKF